jgi:hypothetical protein
MGECHHHGVKLHTVFVFYRTTEGPTPGAGDKNQYSTQATTPIGEWI